MKKLIIFFLAIVFFAAGCKTSKQTEYTILGEYSPWDGFNEKLIGKVDKMVERVYWGVANGDTILKKKLITSHQADSMQWGYPFEIDFDEEGNVISCVIFNEKNRYVGGWQFFKKDNRLDSAVGRWHDTLNVYQKLKCNENGIIIEASQYRSKLDTLMINWKKSITNSGDTIIYQLFNNKGVLINKYLNLYNEKGQYLGYEAYNKDGIFNGSIEMTYNEQGKVSGFTVYDKDKKASDVINRTYPEYDAKGNWLKMISKDSHGKIAVYERTYTYFQ
jgi:uncharacterized protein YuzE